MPAPPAPAPGIVFHLTGPHGRLVGVSIPPPPGPAPPAQEQAFTDTLAPTRRPSFTAGRLALRLALADLGLPSDVPLLPDARGAPTVPAGIAGSISHKRALAVGLAAAVPPGTQLGVDLEELRPLRMNIAPRVLTPNELALLAALPAGSTAHDRFVLARFSLKEAFYKAVNAFAGPHVSFQALEITAIGDDGAVVWSSPLLAEHGLVAHGWLTEISGHLLSTARIGSASVAHARSQ
jgi:4'-phosphopantetheinyl transferase EntD